MKDTVLVVLGPTASGKTRLSVDLAKRFNGEVISADSMQIYRDMDIGTAKVTEEEKQGIEHHLVDFVSPDREYSLNDWLRDANDAIKDILSRNRLPVIAGGTGLYISSLTDNISLSEEEPDEEFRRYLYSVAENEGGYSLWRMVKEIDPEASNRISRNDVKRLSRVLEKYHAGAESKSSEASPYRFIKIGLRCSDREYLYNRINRRVDLMIENGLLEEARKLYRKNLSKTASQAIGYKELFGYFDGTVSLDSAVESVKLESRRYAKRQLTWFNRDKDIKWYEIDRLNYDEILNSCIEYIAKK